MTQRITMTMSDDVVKVLRALQAKKIKDTQKSVSFSAVVDGVVREALL